MDLKETLQADSKLFAYFQHIYKSRLQYLIHWLGEYHAEPSTHLDIHASLVIKVLYIFWLV